MRGLNSFLPTRGVAATLLLPLLMMPAVGFAHEAKSGWTYPYACCSNNDCREVPASTISERPEGYVINPTGEVVAYTDRRVRDSPDGVYHWCSIAGADTSRTICLFVPPKSF